MTTINGKQDAIGFNVIILTIRFKKLESTNDNQYYGAFIQNWTVS